MNLRLTVGLALALVGTGDAAWAQQRPSAMEDAKACAPSERAQPGRPLGTTTGENLSDKLARTDGVICPPDVDPQMKAPTPDAGKMRVIPPPGSPGGDPNVQPK